MAQSLLDTYQSYVSTLNFFQSQGKLDLVKGILKDLLDRQETDSYDYQDFKETLKLTEIGKKVNSFRKESGSLGEIARTLVAQWKAAILRKTIAVSSDQSINVKIEECDKGVKDLLADKPASLSNLKIKRERLSPVPSKSSSMISKGSGSIHNESSEHFCSDQEGLQTKSRTPGVLEENIVHTASFTDNCKPQSETEKESLKTGELPSMHSGTDSFEAALLGVDAVPQSKPRKRSGPDNDSKLKIKMEKQSSSSHSQPLAKSKDKLRQPSSSNKHSDKPNKADSNSKMKTDMKQESKQSSERKHYSHKSSRKLESSRLKQKNKEEISPSKTSKSATSDPYKSASSTATSDPYKSASSSATSDPYKSASSSHAKHKSNKSERNKKHKSKYNSNKMKHKSSNGDKDQRHKSKTRKAERTVDGSSKGSNSHSTSLVKPSEDPQLQPLLQTPLPAHYLNSLPELSTEYRPQPQAKQEVNKNSTSNLDYLINSKKDQLTAVYSGKSRGLSQLFSLQKLCEHVLIANIDNLGYVGDVPYSLLKSILEKASASQLYTIEDYNAEFTQESDELWKAHVARDFRGSKPQDMESWRECYLRLYEEREQKFNNLKNRIAEKTAKTADDARKAKVAYPTLSQPKPPKDVRRQQTKYGTGTGTLESTARAHSLMKAESTSRKITPVQSQTRKQVKVIAPLMMKAKKFMSKLNR